MEYQVEELTSLKKKVSVKVPAEEVNAALGAAISIFKKDLKLKGFRKGKVPSHIVEKRFKKDIYSQAQVDLINVHFNQIFNELQIEPIAGINLDVIDSFERDKDFSYAFSFEVKPQIDLPEYHGIKVKKRKINVRDDEVEKVIERIRKQNSKLELTGEDRNPQDGDVVVIDFETYENGEPLEKFKGTDIELALGEGESLKEFEDIVKSLKPGEKGEGVVPIPEDFINPDVAGKTLTMKVHLKTIKERKYPTDEELLEKFNLKSMDELYEQVRKNLSDFKESIERMVVQEKIMEYLLSNVDFPLPESLVNDHINYLIEREVEMEEKRGRRISASEEELKEKYRKQAERSVRAHLVLLEVAKKEELTVTNEDFYREFLKEALNTGEPVDKIREYYEKNNLMFALRDRILADKAMEKLYGYANIEEVEDDELEGESLSEEEKEKGVNEPEKFQEESRQDELN